MQKNKIIQRLFTTMMVQAIMDGTKDMTRRLVEPKYKIENVRPVMRCQDNEEDWGKYILTDEYGEDFLIESPARVGDVFWVRETWAEFLGIDPNKIDYVYKADKVFDTPAKEHLVGNKWKPSIHMPKVACRLFLEVLSVKVERLQDISEQDAIREGIKFVGSDLGFGTVEYPGDWFENYGEFGYSFLNAKDSFRSLWKSIYGAESWAANPWVWVYEFKKTTAPVGFLDGGIINEKNK